MYSLVPLAQSAHTPIDGLTGADGLSGGQYAQHIDYKKFIEGLGKTLTRNLRAVQSEA